MNRRSFLRTVSLVAVAPLVAATATAAAPGNGYASSGAGGLYGRDTTAHGWLEIGATAVASGAVPPVGAIVYTNADTLARGWRVCRHEPTDAGGVLIELRPA